MKRGFIDEMSGGERPLEPLGDLSEQALFLLFEYSYY